MLFAEKEIYTNDGRIALLRNARPEDAISLIQYLKITAAETPYLMKEPEEITLTLEQEEAFIRQKMESERDLLLIASIDGELAGNCAFNSMGAYQRYAHRCSVAIALYQKYCGLGLGRQMLLTALETAKSSGYEQASLEVVAENKNAVALYQSLGFEIYGTLKKDMKYKNGTYADTHLMIKYF